MTLNFPIFNRAKKAVQGALCAAMLSLSGAITHIARANLWRDQFNPLRGLTMRRVVGYLEEGERGAYADLQWVYRFIEKRDATLRGGKRSLLGAVSEKDWEIRECPEDKLPAGYTAAQAAAQGQALRTAYDRIDNMRAAIEHLGLAEFRGFAHLEKHFAQGGQNDGAITHLEPVEQWYLCREGLNGAWHYNDGAFSGRTRGIEIDTARWIIREVEDPINEIALISFVRKSMSQKDWDGFIEAFGIPSIFAVMPANVPQGKELEYQSVMETVVSNSRGVLPNTADIKTVSAGQLGAAPFSDHLEYQDKQIVLAITSGLLTMLAESGSGTLAGGAHSATFDRIVRALAKRISETFQAQFDKPLLEELFPGQACLAWFEISANEEEDTGEYLKNVKTAADAGYRVDPEQIEEKTGMQFVEERKAETGDRKAKPPIATGFNRQPLNFPVSGFSSPVLENRTREEFAGAFREDMSPLTGRLAELLALEGEAFDTAAAALRADLPTLLSEINDDPAAGEMLAEIFGEQFLAGLTPTTQQP